MVNILRSRSGSIKDLNSFPKDKEVYPAIHCAQEIPCNPCTEACVLHSIKIKEDSIIGRPQFEGDCLGCARCIALCPGLAITLVDKRYDKTKKTARIIIPWEMPEGTIKIGEEVTTTGIDGEIIGKGKIIAMKNAEWQNKRKLVSLEIPYEDADKVVNIRIREPLGKETATAIKAIEDGEVIICRCERVTKKEIIDYIKKTGTKDINAVKAALRIGMGPCGGKTCTELILRIFRELGIDPKDVEPHVERPFNQEVPLKAFLNKGENK